MKNMYDIAVIGESMSGKSTWISALFKEDVYKILKAKCEENKCGQTKVPVSYILLNPSENSLQVQNIDWCTENLLTYERPTESETGVDELLNKLGITDILKTAKIPTDEQEDLEDRMLTYLNNSAYKNLVKSLPVDYVFGIINDKEINDMNLISCIEVSGPADTEIWESIKKYNLDGVRVRDTRGFLDDSLSWMQKQDEEVQNERKSSSTISNENFESTDSTERHIQNLLDNRNICGVDACVFMSIAGVNSLQKEAYKNLYGPLISYMLKNHPTLLTLRDDQLTRKLFEQAHSKDVLSYDKASTEIKADDFYAGFDALRELLESHGLFKKSSSIRTIVAQKHYTELLIPDIASTLRKKYPQEAEEIYRTGVKGSFACVLAKTSEYYQNIEDAEKCLKEINEEFKKTLIKLYDTEFISGLRYVYLNCWNSFFRYDMRYLSNKIQGPYFGGLVGVRGGLTTWINGRRVGDAAIDFLEAAYRMRDALYEKIPDALEPEINSYVKNILPGGTDSPDFSAAVNRMKQSIENKLSQMLNSDYEHLSCTYRMVKRSSLQAAQKQTCEELQAEPDYIGRYLAELKDCFTHENWKSDLHFTSIVKQMLWHLVETEILF